MIQIIRDRFTGIEYSKIPGFQLTVALEKLISDILGTILTFRVPGIGIKSDRCHLDKVNEW